MQIFLEKFIYFIKWNDILSGGDLIDELAVLWYVQYHNLRDILPEKIQKLYDFAVEE